MDALLPFLPLDESLSVRFSVVVSSASDITKLELEIQHLNNWLCYNGLCPNPDKAEVIILAHQRNFERCCTVNIPGAQSPYLLKHQCSVLPLMLP